MRFHAGSQPPEDLPRREPAILRHALLVSCAIAAAATAFVWSHVEFSRLWGEGLGPRGVETTEGFSCLMACLLTLAMGMLDDRSGRAREAVLPGMMAATVAGALVMLARAWRGPELLRGVTASSTVAFYVALAAGLTAAALSIWRHGLSRPPHRAS